MKGGLNSEQDLSSPGEIHRYNDDSRIYNFDFLWSRNCKFFKQNNTWKEKSTCSFPQLTIIKTEIANDCPLTTLKMI